MTARTVFPPKGVAEQLGLQFFFASYLLPGETLSSANVSNSVYSGTDASPSAMIGSIAVVSPTVTAEISGGVAGVVYYLLCTAVTSAGRDLSIGGYLAVTQEPS